MRGSREQAALLAGCYGSPMPLQAVVMSVCVDCGTSMHQAEAMQSLLCGACVKVRFDGYRPRWARVRTAYEEDVAADDISEREFCPDEEEDDEYEPFFAERVRRGPAR